MPHLPARRTFHVLRVISACALLGAAAAGTLFGWLPAMGLVGAHEIGALLGAGVGAVASAKHAI